jgi:hypothetical protein
MKTGMSLLILVAAFGFAWARAAEGPPSVGAPICAPNASFKVADFSMPLSTGAIDRMRSLGIVTAFRYYDHVDETLPGKTLRASEAKALVFAGLNVAVVFQHHNDDPAKFLIPDIGARDAERALELAKEIDQPYGSAIYFGVDGPERHLAPLINEYKLNNGQAMSDNRKAALRTQGQSRLVESYEQFFQYGPAAFGTDDLARVRPEMMKPLIERYFNSVQTVFQKHAKLSGGKIFKVGMYCTAAMCLLGSEKHLADFFWVSPEGRKDPEYGQFLENQNRWNLLQQLPTVCSSNPANRDPRLEFDFDYVNPIYPDFGQWKSFRAVGPPDAHNH